MFTISKNSVGVGSVSALVRQNITSLGIGLLILIHLVGVVGMLSPIKDFLLGFTPMILSLIHI